MTARPAIDGERDADGVLHVSRDTGGCPYCGTVEQNIAEGGLLILYRPGAECCAKRLTDVITYIAGEVAELERRIADVDSLVADAQRELDTASREFDKQKAQKELDKVERRRTNVVKECVAMIREHDEELRHLRAKRAALDRESLRHE